MKILPIKCLQAENIFDIFECIILGFEEIGFQILSIIIYNNAISKKNLYLFVVIKAFNCIPTPSYDV